MPVLAFQTRKEFEQWLKTYVKPTKYLLFAATETMEIIAQPTVSTRPRMVGYLKVAGDIRAYIKKLSETYGIKYFAISRYGWDTDRHPSIKYKYEQE